MPSSGLRHYVRWLEGGEEVVADRNSRAEQPVGAGVSAQLRHARGLQKFLTSTEEDLLEGECVGVSTSVNKD